MSEEIRVWGIHTLDDNLFLKENIVAIGWNEVGDLSKIAPDRDAFKKKYIETYPNDKKMKVATSAGMLYRFAHEIQIGDYIVFPSKINREINIGTVESNYSKRIKYLHFERIWCIIMTEVNYNENSSVH